MNLFESLTRKRYQNKNVVTSFQFIDFIITEVHNMVPSALPASPTIEKEIGQELVAVARKIFTFSRYEPHNPYILHKRVPSARNIHPNEGYLVIHGQILRVNPRSCQLDYIGYNPRYQNKIYLCVVSELWRVMKYYGEFGLSLSLLDAGHILAEIKKELEHRGFEKSVLWEHLNNSDFLFSLGLNNGMYLNYVVDLSPYLSDKKQMGYLSANHNTEIYSVRDKNYEEEVGQFPGVSNFLKSWEYRKAVPKKLIPHPNQAGRTDNNSTRENYRNSNHSYYGLFSLTDCISYSMVHKIAKTILDEIDQYINQSYQYSIYLLFCNEAGNHQLISIKKGKVYHTKELKKLEKYHILHDSKESINISSFPLIAFISYHIGEEEEEESIYAAHIGAGEISQYLSNQVRELGFFARPMKNFNDEYIQELIHLDPRMETMIYMTIFGVGNAYQYSMQLQE